MHTRAVQRGLRYGIYLFILSEVALFISFFASILYCYGELTHLVACEIPFKIMILIDPMKLPLLNTLLLGISSIFLTFAHIELTANHGASEFGNRRFVISAVLMTIIFGILFVCCQY